MIQSEAIRLISKIPIAAEEIWADFGCGSGFFTEALAVNYPEIKEIYGIDLLSQPTLTKSNIQFIQADFVKDHLNLPLLNGILMANSLHYVQDKVSFLEKTRKYFKDGNGKWLIVEYEQDTPNRWIPYPINFKGLNELFSKAGYKNINYISDRKSSYGRTMYSALINQSAEKVI